MALSDDLIVERERLMPKFAEWHGLEFEPHNEWKPARLAAYTALATFINFPHSYMSTFGVNECPERFLPALETMRLLNSPNGYTVYRMMLLKKNELPAS